MIIKPSARDEGDDLSMLSDERLLRLAKEVAKNSTCPRAEVGAIISRGSRILAAGCNKAPKGLPQCADIGCLVVGGHCVRALHAEQNAIIQALLSGASLHGASIFVTHQPCVSCAKMIIEVGLCRVVYALEYHDEPAYTFLRQAGVELVQLALC